MSELTREFLRGIDRAIEGTVNGIIAAPTVGLRLYRRVSWQRLAWVTAIVVGVLILAVGIAWVADGRYTFTYWREGGDKTSRSEVFRNFGLVVVAVVGLLFGMWRAWTAYLQTKTGQRQAEIEEQGQFTTRFTSAVEQLGSPQLPVRLGGIYALWRLAKDSPAADLTSVFDILSAFVRNPPREDEANTKPTASVETCGSSSSADRETPFRQDVQAILKLIGDGKSEQRKSLPIEYRVDISGAYLENADLGGTDFAHGSMIRTYLRNANLIRTNLTSASLFDVDLTDALVVNANFTNASLPGAIIVNALLIGSDFTGANLLGSKLSESDFTRAKFIRADVRSADLTGADLTEANLTEANLESSDLTGVDLTRANLQDAKLSGAKIDETKFPKGFDPTDKV